MIIGFTGTRKGMTEKQKRRLRILLEVSRSAAASLNVFHHGDCIGADAEAHDIAVDMKYDVVVHPPKNPRYRAFKRGIRTLRVQDYLDRNKNIVDSCEYLIAAPSGPEQRRSGTWSTVRYAVKRKRLMIIVKP